MAPSQPTPNDESEVHLHGDYLLHFALWHVRNEIVAQDLVQETFLAAIRSRAGFKGQSSIRVWLVGIMRHKIMDYFRQRRREDPLLLDQAADDEDDNPRGFMASSLAELQDPRHSPSEQVELIEFREALDSALGRLPFRMAKAFELYEIDGLTGPSVCAQLQISPQNFWVTLHRARKKLGDELAPWRYESA